MALEQQTTLQDRLQTFKRWKTPFLHPEDLAYAGFVKDTDSSMSDAVMCVFCRKPLEGWQENESPFVEHERHSPDCVLFNLHDARAREAMFKHGFHTFPDTAVKDLSRKGLVLYNLTPGTVDLFCYACGFICSIDRACSRSLGRKVKELHTQATPVCYITHRVRMEKKGRGAYLANSPFSQVLAKKVDIQTMPRVFVSMEEGKLCTSTPSVEEVVQLPEPDTFISQLFVYATPEEKETLSLRETLSLALERMVEETRKITDKDMGDIRIKLDMALAPSISSQ
ncbi:hypothetical protein NEDG_00896 [Nematocida displodere]|uniref:Uncharacterized protein n=1 Tax=Nematocida displodere TaxID=1805483 RepID=A0A177ECT0_9MICR|nr:hypothetical protein NEDG_00896 [Nematocida displodere]